jgi:hypothetical protein
VLQARTSRILFRMKPLITYSMKQSSSWKAKWFSASQEIPGI